MKKCATLTLMKPLPSVYRHYSVVLLSVLPQTLSDRFHVTTLTYQHCKVTFNKSYQHINVRNVRF